jgi:hypothetical protein
MAEATGPRENPVHIACYCLLLQKLPGMLTNGSHLG